MNKLSGLYNVSFLSVCFRGRVPFSSKSHVSAVLASRSLGTWEDY